MFAQFFFLIIQLGKKKKNQLSQTSYQSHKTVLKLYVLVPKLLSTLVATIHLDCSF